MSQYDWLNGSHMTKVVWLPNETDDSHCEFCGAKYSVLDSLSCDFIVLGPLIRYLFLHDNYQHGMLLHVHSA